MTDIELLNYAEGRWTREAYLDYHLSRIPVLECQERLLELNLKRREIKEIERGVKFFSQPTTCQDEWVIETLGRKRDGFFVDVGAYDGITDSNTAMLEKCYGWSGICIEAGISFFDLIKKRNCHCVNACVDAVEREVEFLTDGQLSGVVDEKADWRESDPKTRAAITSKRLGGYTVRMHTISLPSLLQGISLPCNFDYLSLDIQGMEQPVILSFPFDEYTPKLITLENCEPNIVEFLEAKGYYFVKKVMLDGFFVHRSV